MTVIRGALSACVLLFLPPQRGSNPLAQGEALGQDAPVFQAPTGRNRRPAHTRRIGKTNDDCAPSELQGAMRTVPRASPWARGFQPLGLNDHNHSNRCREWPYNYRHAPTGRLQFPDRAYNGAL